MGLQTKKHNVWGPHIVWNMWMSLKIYAGFWRAKIWIRSGMLRDELWVMWFGSVFVEVEGWSFTSKQISDSDDVETQGSSVIEHNLDWTCWFLFHRICSPHNLFSYPSMKNTIETQVGEICQVDADSTIYYMCIESNTCHFISKLFVVWFRGGWRMELQSESHIDHMVRSTKSLLDTLR